MKNMMTVDLAKVKQGVRTSNPQLDLDPNVPGYSNRPQTSAQPSKKRRIDLDLDLPVEAWRSCFTIFWGNNQVVYARNHGTLAHKLIMIET